MWGLASENDRKNPGTVRKTCQVFLGSNRLIYPYVNCRYAISLYMYHISSTSISAYYSHSFWIHVECSLRFENKHIFELRRESLNTGLRTTIMPKKVSRLPIIFPSALNKQPHQCLYSSHLNAYSPDDLKNTGSWAYTYRPT